MMRLQLWENLLGHPVQEWTLTNCVVAFCSELYQEVCVCEHLKPVKPLLGQEGTRWRVMVEMVGWKWRVMVVIVGKWRVMVVVVVERCKWRVTVVKWKWRVMEAAVV